MFEVSSSSYSHLKGAFLPNCLLEWPLLSNSAKICYVALVSFAGKGKQTCWPSQATLADKYGSSDRSTREHLKELAESGLITIQRNGLQLANTYEITDLRTWAEDPSREEEIRRSRAALLKTLSGGFPPLGSAEKCQTDRRNSAKVGDSILIEEPRSLEPRSLNLRESENPFSREEAPAAQKSNPATAAENPATSLAHEDLTPSGGGFVYQSTLQLDEEVGTFIANVYRQSRGAKSPKAAELKRMAYKIAEKEASHGPEEFRAALLNFLGTSNDWLRENKWPLHTFLKTINGYVVEPQSRSSASRAPVPSRTSSGAPAIDPAKAFDKTPTPADEFVSEWNNRNPSRPVGVLITPTRKKFEAAMRDPDFVDNFGAICGKAAKMIAAGEDTTFEWLFVTGKDGAQKWGDLLEGKFDFLMKAKPVKAGELDWDEALRLADEIDAKKKAKKETTK